MSEVDARRERRNRELGERGRANDYDISYHGLAHYMSHRGGCGGEGWPFFESGHCTCGLFESLGKFREHFRISSRKRGLDPGKNGGDQ